NLRFPSDLLPWRLDGFNPPNTSHNSFTIVLPRADNRFAKLSQCTSMKRFNLQLMLAAAVCCGVVFAVFGLSQNRVAKDLVVHEWGTFTSIQGSDGVPLYWQSRNIAPLPAFVYDWKRPGLADGWQRSPGTFGKT